MIKTFISGSPRFMETESEKILGGLKNADVEKYFGEELDKNEFFSFVNSVSLFGNPKAAFVRNAHNVKNLAEFIKATEKCTETHLILSADKEALKDPAKLLKNTSYTLLKDKTEKPSPAQVTAIFKEKGMDISYIHAQEIFDITAGDMMAAAGEAEKFAVYRLTNDKITMAELMNHAWGSREEPVYKLTEAFSGRRASEAFKIYDTILKTEQNLRIIFFSLAKRAANLYYSHLSPALVNEYQDFVKRDVEEHRRYWPRGEAAALAGLAARLDVDVKTGAKQLENAVNELLALCGKKRN